MGRLFLKIFLWFWLAQVFIGVVMFQLMGLMRSLPGDTGGQRPFSTSIALQAKAAAIIYQNQGKAALDAEMRQGPGTSQTYTVAFDGAGQQLAGRQAPAEAQQLALRAASSGIVEYDNGQDGLLVARAAPLGNGRQIVVVSQIRRKNANILLSDLQNPSRTGYIRLAAFAISSALVCYALAWYFASPTLKLRRATRQLAGGDLTTRVASQMGRRRDELADLGRDFDQMAERIETLMTSERRLLADISHELRSPLARLNVALDLAEDDSDKATQDYLKRIRRESERLNELIGQVLALSRLESGSTRIEKHPVNLTELLHEVAHDAQFEAAGRDRQVRVVEADNCWTAGDATLLRSAIENVVRNAIHYTPEGSAVELSLKCRANGTESLIRVRDHGEGVPEESLTQLFRPFYRVADARDRQSGGTGLGLAITERAVRFHGGNVCAHNAAGGGLEIVLSFPLQR